MKYYTLFAFFGLAALVFAHGGGHPTRYVAPTGSDEGECGSPSTACATINFAVQQSNKGDKVRVAAGTYVVDELEVFYLLSAMVEIKGGFNKADGFDKQDAVKNPTLIEGVPYQYRQQLAERGFQLLQDEKGLESGLTKNEKAWLQTYSKLTTTQTSAQACVNGMAGDNPCHNIDRVAHMPLSVFSSSPSSANDIWGFVDLNNQREYALIGLNNGTAVVDVSDASAPVEIAYISALSSTWRDIKVYQFYDDADDRYKAYAYVTTESDQGLQIIDLSDLPNSASLVANPTGDFSRAHNVYLANTDYATGLALPGMTPYLYISGSNKEDTGGVFLTYDLSDPVSPSLITQGSSGYVHDATTLVIDDERTADCAPGHNPCEILIDFNEDTVDIWDMTNKSAPVLISETSYSNVGYVHSGWWSSDKMTVFVQDELDERNRGLNTTLRAMDISDLSSPCVKSIYTGPTSAIDHNGFTKGDYYYMSNYRRGLSVLDVSDVSDIKDVGYFDTFAVPSENTASFNGAWGTYPYLASENILVSDIEYGLWILKLNEDDGVSSQAGSTTVSDSCEAGSDDPVVDVPSTPGTGSSSNSTGNSGGGGLPLSCLCVLLWVWIIRRRP